MLQKNAYEPKDARIMSYYDDDQDDDDLSDLDPSRPSISRKKKTTGTQALAEFLSTTSPEEFQRNQKGNTPVSSASPAPPTEPSSTNFFKLRKSKRPFIQRQNTSDLISNLGISSTSTLVSAGPSSVLSTSSTQSVPSTAHKKNYIEIVPKATPSTPTPQQHQQSSSSSPMLPQMGQHKKRESSLYSGSLRYSASIKSQLSGGGATTGRKVGRSLARQDTSTTLRSMASGHTINSLHQKPQQQHGTTEKESMDDQQKRNLTQAFLSSISKMELIEAGLVQRLERCKLAGYEKPSDTVANLLVNEHLRALDVSFQQETHGKLNNNNNNISIKARHAQVQTMTWKADGESDLTTQPLSGEPPKHNNDSSPVTTAKTQSPPTTMEQLEKQLAEEREQRQRLQASLDDTRDHFEVLSGLAYKKLREIWEEKLRWENTCIQLNEQLILIQQQQQEHTGHYQQGFDEMVETGSVLDKENQLTLSVVS